MTFDQLRFTLDGISFKKRLCLFTHGVRFMMRAGVAAGIPPIVQLEPVNVCNLHCLTCATGSGLMTRPREIMPFKTFRSVIDQVKGHSVLLVFWSWGEPFMHKDAPRMIRYAKNSGLLVHTSTNGHFFTTKEQAKAVVDSGLDSLIIAMDGLDQKTYEKYRRGGDLKKVVQSIENLISERAKAGTGKPLLTFRFIVMKHNEHQVHKVIDFSKRLGVDFVTFRSAIVRRKSVDLEESLTPQALEFQRFTTTDRPSNKIRPSRHSHYCHRPYANLTVLSNGDVVACENDFNATLPLGNMTQQSLREILASRQSKAFYHQFHDNPNNFSFCRECDLRDLKHATANVQTIVLNRALTHNEKISKGRGKGE